MNDERDDFDGDGRDEHEHGCIRRASGRSGFEHDLRRCGIGLTEVLPRVTADPHGVLFVWPGQTRPVRVRYRKLLNPDTRVAELRKLQGHGMTVEFLNGHAGIRLVIRSREPIPLFRTRQRTAAEATQCWLVRDHSQPLKNEFRVKPSNG